MSSQQTLAPAQRRIFEKMGNELENREYTKALRSADAILSVVPEHADTLAVKGVSMFNLDHKEEGYEIIKKAIALNPGSTMAWHSLGVCQRSDRNYHEALKAFKRTLTTDPNNFNVMRDISSICIQLRDWEQFLEFREKMLKLKSGIRANWIALSCGHRILGNYKLAAAMMDVMASIMSCGDHPAEVSEVQLYRVELELESGEPQRALELLKRHDAEIRDTVMKLLLRAKAHAQLGQKAEATKRYMELISMGFHEADCIAAIAQLRKIPLDAYLRPKRDVDKYMEMMDQVLEVTNHKGSNYAIRHILDCVPLDQFRERLITFVKPYIMRLIPSIVSILKSLYRDEDRAKAVGEVFQQWEQELLLDDFSGFGREKNPCYILWVWMFLASHYRRTGDYATAHNYIDKAIAHTPTLELLYLEKSKIYAREGKTSEMAQCADFCRKLDLQDKYLNSKAAKYFFRDNQIEKGEETMQLFYKESVVQGDTYLTALESQCAWYGREVGEAFYRRGDYISALQNLLLFEKHHYNNHCELTDFHAYVFRRCTMRPWFNVLDCDDNIGKNKFFLKQCPAIVRCYMKVDELGEEAVRAAHTPRPELVLDGIGSEDAKRLKQLRKDYYITNLDLTEPMAKAERYLGYLLENCAHLESVHTLAVEYYTKRKKPLVVARELLALKRLGHRGLGALVEEFNQKLYVERVSDMDDRVRGVVDAILQQIARLD
ncbi:unnamed protein product [Phytomonas sp. EM1]|nr:unnamed protein product [Phytomonas sp. EM1]|eukprot:CCW60002.1 unnamed protein product [Phytomonas sp. isolate EM1]